MSYVSLYIIFAIFQVPIHIERTDKYSDQGGRTLVDVHQPGTELRAEDQEAGRPVQPLQEEVVAHNHQDLLS